MAAAHRGQPVPQGAARPTTPPGAVAGPATGGRDRAGHDNRLPGCGSRTGGARRRVRGAVGGPAGRGGAPLRRRTLAPRGCGNHGGRGRHGQVEAQRGALSPAQGGGGSVMTGPGRDDEEVASYVRDRMTDDLPHDFVEAVMTEVQYTPQRSGGWGGWPWIGGLATVATAAVAVAIGLSIIQPEVGSSPSPSP